MGCLLGLLIDLFLVVELLLLLDVLLEGVLVFQVVNELKDVSEGWPF